MADVLVVDDDDDIRDLIAMRVRRAGHDVTSVGDPLAAVAYATTAHLDIALVDWSMPVMNGGELCMELRRMPQLSGMPILVVTAHADLETRERALAAGADDVLTKPFSMGDLGARVAELLERPRGAGGAAPGQETAQDSAVSGTRW